MDDAQWLEHARKNRFPCGGTYVVMADGTLIEYDLFANAYEIACKNVYKPEDELYRREMKEALSSLHAPFTLFEARD